MIGPYAQTSRFMARAAKRCKAVLVREHNSDVASTGNTVMGETEIRESEAGDRRAIEALYPEVFPREDLLPLVRALLDEGAAVLSLVAVVERAVAGHGVFTRCSVAGSSAPVALLGPVAIAPRLQKRGLGSALIRDGFRRMEAEGAAQVCVLGDPAYYKRFGFAPERHVAPPYALPEEWRGAWQSVRLGGGHSIVDGKLTVPQPWRDPALWAP
jgi:putative acetyltransferase